jgi:hypothetical protein
MTYYYSLEDLPEVEKNWDGTYTVEGSVYAASSVNTEENVKNEIDKRLALLHFVQAENDAADLASYAAELVDAWYALFEQSVKLLERI